MPAARPSQPVIRNALEAAKDAGFAVQAMEITRDGTLRILVAGDASALSSGKKGPFECPDDAFGTAAE